MTDEPQEPLEFFLRRVEHQIDLAHLYGKWDSTFRVNLDKNRYDTDRAELTNFDLHRLLAAAQGFLDAQSATEKLPDRS